VLRLRYERFRRGLSQAGIAAAARVPQPMVSLIERGRLVPTPAQLTRLAAVLDIPPDDLLRDVSLLTPVEPPQ
jgi:transcriptional regulator with XRE-family HTH domain